MSKGNKRGPKPIRRNEVILSLRDKKRATSAELGVATAYLFTLLQAGIVTRAGKTAASGGGKGRPATVWSLSKAGHGKASAMLRKQKVAA